MKNRFIQTLDNFSNEARRLRSHYDACFKDPLHGTAERFAWDYWHVPDQYTLVRTPAESYFPKPLISKFVRELTAWGQENLGCLSISPPWLSYYIEGCEQKLHSDAPHGPWAFVFSLTSQKVFQGGETLIFKPERLHYWNEFSAERGLEEDDLFHKISPKFNRLVIFDPRLPHGVTRVTGTQDPRTARLVVHGWFTQPSPIIKGYVSLNEIQNNLEVLFSSLEKTLNEISPVTGTQSYNLSINKNGSVSKIRLLTNTLVSRDGREDQRRALTQWLQLQMKNFKFKKRKGSSTLILPLIFE